MIKTFADRHTRDLYNKARSARFPQEIWRRAFLKLSYVDAAATLGDLGAPPSNRLHGLAGDREGYYSISINDQWRICFRWLDGDAYDVEVTDYH